MESSKCLNSPRSDPWTSIVLIYIYHLSLRILSNLRFFTDDTSIFSIVRDVYTSANNLNNDLVKFNKRVNQWKKRFDLDSSKQAQEVIFIVKLKKKICVDF